MIIITADLFDIAARLKEIDDSYIVVYNKQKEKFELHRTFLGRVGYELTFPFDKLDVRAINFCYETRKERLSELIAKLDKENEALEKAERSEAIKKAENRIDELFRKL